MKEILYFFHSRSQDEALCKEGSIGLSPDLHVSMFAYIARKQVLQPGLISPSSAFVKSFHIVLLPFMHIASKKISLQCQI